MNDKNGFNITTRDKVLLAWEYSTELVRSFQTYSHTTEEDDSVAEMFSKFAEDEAVHASQLRDILIKYESDSTDS